VIRQFLAGKEIQSLPPGMLIEKLRDDLKFLRDGLGVQVIMETVPDDLNISGAVEQDLYLVLREGLMNIARHSHASVANVTLTQTDNEVRGSLTDDGVGFDLNQSANQGVGLSSMKERIEKLGGKLEIQSSPGTGAKLSFRLPLVAESVA
jgi:signal transduction histidine kinase